MADGKKTKEFSTSEDKSTRQSMSSASISQGFRERS